MTSLQSLSNTPVKTRKKKEKKPIQLEDIKYLDIHAEKITKNNGNKDAVKKANNKKNNDMREELIEFIFRMNERHSYLTQDSVYQNRWIHWFNESLKIKRQLQTMYKNETGLQTDGKFHIRQRGGSRYSYDFAVRISNESKTKRTFIPLEYKHQSSLGKLPQFYQVSNVSQPLFEQPYHEYYFNEGLGEVAELIGVNINLTKNDMSIYSKTIGKSVWPKKTIELMKQGKLTDNNNVNKVLKTLRENYELSPKGKSQSYKSQQKIVSKTIQDYLKLMQCGFINDELINKLQNIILTKQKPIDPTSSNGKPKDKIYLLCEFKGNELYWKLNQFPREDFMLRNSPNEVIVNKENIMFPTISGKYINLRLRWQNVSGLCNPSWQFNLKDYDDDNEKERAKTPPRKSKTNSSRTVAVPTKTLKKRKKTHSKGKTKRSRTVAGPVVSILKGILRQNNLKVSGNKKELLQRLEDNNINY